MTRRALMQAGAALALMEIAADYGAAQHFGLTTMATAIFRAWYAHGAPHAALGLSAFLLIAALAFLALPSFRLGTPKALQDVDVVVVAQQGLLFFH